MGQKCKTCDIMVYPYHQRPLDKPDSGRTLFIACNKQADKVVLQMKRSTIRASHMKVIFVRSVKSWATIVEAVVGDGS